MLASSIAGYYEEQEKGSQFNFPTRCSIFAHNICSVRWEEHEREGGGGVTPYSPIWLGGLSRSTPVMRILELERESFLVRLEMVLSREDTWRPARERLSQYHRCIQFFSWNRIVTSTISESNLLLQAYFIYFSWNPYLTSTQFQSHCLASIYRRNVGHIRNNQARSYLSYRE